MSGIPNVMQTGRSGMMASKAAIATTGHNISNANTEGYSRQRVHTHAEIGAIDANDKRHIGSGVGVSKVERVNDEYITRQIQNSGRQLSHFEEKAGILQQVEDVFNEMNGDGLNRLIAQFFNEFRKLANDPNSEAVRQSVREATASMVNDFHRLRHEVGDIQKHIDSRINGYVTEINSLTKDLTELNLKIKATDLAGGSPPDLLDSRDEIVRKLNTYMDLSVHTSNDGMVSLDIKGVGPLVSGSQREIIGAGRAPDDQRGKADNLLEITSTGSAQSSITHSLKGGKLGGLVELRDQTNASILSRLDELAFVLGQSVNEIHKHGYDRYGNQGVNYFKPMGSSNRAAEFLDLSDEIKSDANFIATAAVPDAPGDNRIATSIANLQNIKILGNGNVSFDDWFNSVVSDVGVLANKNKSSMNQQKNIQSQLGKMREQIAGVSIDEETANLLQFQHTFDASAKVIQVADEMLKTVLELKR